MPSEPSTDQASELRLIGFTAKTLEAGTGFGGVWHLNRYPGTRVDSETPTYQLNLPQVWTVINLSERYPGHEGLRKYFCHLDNSLDLQKDTLFGARVSKVEFNQTSKTWTFHTQHGLRATSTYAIFAVGASFKPHIPEWPGVYDYKGQIIHPAAWPEDFDAGGKEIGVIGQGASGLQIVQELAKEDCQLSVFIRTPSMCIPMNQKAISIQQLFEGTGLPERCNATSHPNHQEPIPIRVRTKTAPYPPLTYCSPALLTHDSPVAYLPLPYYIP